MASITTAQLRWLHGALPDSDPQKAYIQETYAEDLRTGEEYWTVFLKWRDREWLPNLLRQQSCPIEPELHKYHLPLPMTPTRAPRPSNPGKTRLEGKSRPVFEQTTNPIPAKLEPPRSTGPNFELAAAQTFQSTTPGRHVGMQEYSFVSMAYRHDEEQRQKARDDEKKKQSVDFPVSWIRFTASNAKAISNKIEKGATIKGTSLNGYHELSDDVLKELLEHCHMTDGVVDHFLCILKESDQNALPMTIMSSDFAVNPDADANRLGIDPTSWPLHRNVLVPFCQSDYWTLALIRRDKKSIQLFSPSGAPRLDEFEILRPWIERLEGLGHRSSEWHEEMKVGISTTDHDFSGVVACYHAAVCVAQEAPIEREAGDEEIRTMAQWILQCILNQKVDVGQVAAPQLARQNRR